MSHPDELRRTPASPRLDPAFRGVVIAVGPGARPGALVVHGAIQVPERDFDPGSRVLDCLALVATHLPPGGPYGGGSVGHHAWTPFRERLLLEDDVERTGGLVRGWFNVPLTKELPAPLPDPLYLVASVGPYASDVLTVRGG